MWITLFVLEPLKTLASIGVALMSDLWKDFLSTLISQGVAASCVMKMKLVERISSKLLFCNSLLKLSSSSIFLSLKLLK